MSFLVEKFDQIQELAGRKRHIHRSYDAVFGTPEGEVVLCHIMAEGFISRTTFVAGDPNQTMLNEGSRRLALSILRMARANHKELIRQLEKQMQEHGIPI
jgi:hypothetical protein